MTPEEIEAQFVGQGGFRFARWERPIAPMVLGLEPETLAVVKGAIEAVVTLADHRMAETDPEMGANLYVFFLREWAELSEVPGLEGLIPNLKGIVARLTDAKANQYRMFRFEENGAIRAAFVLLRMDQALSRVPADALALSQAVQAILTWGDGAFARKSPLALANGRAVLRPEIANLVRATYSKDLPPFSDDPAFALRLFARMPGKEG